jgi:acyl carrier protein
MGLDGIELILATEEAFGVTLDDVDIAKVVTPRDLGDLVYKQLETTNEEICQNQKAFYILRKVLMKIYGLKRDDITLEFRLDTVIPKDKQKEHWLNLKEFVKARSWPKLLQPQWMLKLRSVSLLFLLICPVVLFMIFLPVYIAWSGFLVAVTLMVLFQRVFEKKTMRYRCRIPEIYLTIKALVHFVKTSNDIKWTRDQVQKQLRTVIIEKLGLKESQYNDDSSFVADFGMG